MAYIEHVQDFPTCANINHAILNVQVVYCPHDGSYTLSIHLGDCSDRTWSRRTTRYGPFDTISDVAMDIAQYLKVVARRQLLDAAMAHHTGEDGKPLT